MNRRFTFGRMLRTDTARALGNWRFWGAALLVFAMTGISGFQDASGNVVDTLKPLSGGSAPMFLYCLAPVFPYATSYAMEYRERSTRYFCLRSGAARYEASRFCAAVLSGALAYMLGTAVFIAIRATSMPIYIIHPEDTPFTVGYFSLLYEGRPGAYLLCYLLHNALTAALFAGLSFFLTALKPDVYVGTVAPVVLFVMYLRLNNFIKLPAAFNAQNLVQQMYYAETPGQTLLTKAATAVIPLLAMGAGSCLLIRRRLSRE